MGVVIFGNNLKVTIYCGVICLVRFLHNPNGCAADDAKAPTALALDLYNKDEVDVIIGPACSEGNIRVTDLYDVDNVQYSFYSTVLLLDHLLSNH